MFVVVLCGVVEDQLDARSSPWLVKVERPTSTCWMREVMMAVNTKLPSFYAFCGRWHCGSVRVEVDDRLVLTRTSSMVASLDLTHVLCQTHSVVPGLRADFYSLFSRRRQFCTVARICSDHVEPDSPDGV